jgi:hypothetical protein
MSSCKAKKTNQTLHVKKDSAAQQKKKYLRARQGEVTRRYDCMQKKSSVRQGSDRTLRVCMQRKKDARWQTLHAEKELCAREVTAQGRVCMQIKKEPCARRRGK